MPEELRVSPEALKQRAGEIRSKVQSIDEILNNINQEFAKVPDSFGGSGAVEYVNKYNNFKTRYNAFLEEIESYAKFLDKASETYSTLNITIQNLAQENLDD